jgi:hypothetical protein
MHPLTDPRIDVAHRRRLHSQCVTILALLQARGDQGVTNDELSRTAQQQEQTAGVLWAIVRTPEDALREIGVVRP